MSALLHEKVLSVHHWTDRMFGFTTTRSQALRFANGQFIMIGLKINQKPLLRAYSIVSPNYQSSLEFLSIKIANGPLTSHLQHLQIGDEIIMGSKATGTLVVDYLLPGKHLYLLSTGTGLAPFMSIIRDPATYEKYEKIILVHGVRHIKELAYRDYIMSQLKNDDLLGACVAQQLLYYPTVTREPFVNQGRITDLLLSDQFYEGLGLNSLNPLEDKAMVCGSSAMLHDLKNILLNLGFKEGNTSTPGDFVIERAFVS